MLIPGQSDNSIFVIVPVYNDTGELRSVIRDLLSTGYRIIVVDDGSDTPVSNIIHQMPVTIIRHSVNLGQGAALQTGFEYAKKNAADVVITFDADGQHKVDDLPALLLQILQGKADVVLGSRFLPKQSNEVPLSKKIILRAARFINFLFTGILLSDAHNGLRAFNKTALEKISITENRMAHASEILFQIKKHRLRFKEVAVTIHYTKYSRQKGQRASEGIRILFDIFLHKLFK